jgi:hypothetical protein
LIKNIGFFLNIHLKQYVARLIPHYAFTNQ